MQLHDGWDRKSHGLLMTALTFLVLFSGCGKSDRIPTYKVTGKVLVDGKPAKHVILKFHPRKQDSEKPYVPNGLTDESGNFSLATYEKGDGAPAGDYDVTFIWPERKNPISTMWEGDQLNGRYATKEKAKTQVTVAEKDQKLSPFKLSSE